MKEEVRFEFSYADHINTFRIIVEQDAEYRILLHLLFVNFEKSVDSINKECICNYLYLLAEY